MQKNDKCGYCETLLVALFTLFIATNAGAGRYIESERFAGTFTAGRTMTDYERLEGTRSDCRRYGVFWSGGIALRGPDRISPRPIRSRWQRSDDSRIRCSGGDAFKQHQVADEPWIR